MIDYNISFKKALIAIMDNEKEKDQWLEILNKVTHVAKLFNALPEDIKEKCVIEPREKLPTIIV